MLNVVKHPYFRESSRSFTLFRMTNRVYITLKHYCLSEYIITKTVPKCSRQKGCDNLTHHVSGIHDKPGGVCHKTAYKQSTLETCNNSLAAKTGHDIYEQ